MPDQENLPEKSQITDIGLSHDDIANIRFSLRILGYHDLDIKFARMLELNSQRLKERQKLIESHRREIQRQRHRIQDLMIALGNK